MLTSTTTSSPVTSSLPAVTASSPSTSSSINITNSIFTDNQNQTSYLLPPSSSSINTDGMLDIIKYYLYKTGRNIFNSDNYILNDNKYNDNFYFLTIIYNLIRKNNK